MKKGFWSSDWFAGVAYGLVFILVAYVIFGDGFNRTETAAYDLGMNLTSAAPAPDIAVIAVDDASIQTLGRWPWPRDYHAELIHKLAQDGAQVIGFTIFLSEAQQDAGSIYIKDMMNFYDSSSLGAAAPFAAPAPAGSTAAPAPKTASITVPGPVRTDLEDLRKRLQEADEVTDTDSKLAAAMQQSGKVVIPMLFTLGQPLGNQGDETPDYLLRNALGATTSDPEDVQPLATKGMTPPLADFAKTASIGYLDEIPDSDGVLRSEPLALRYYNVYYPSMSLAIAMKSLNLKPEDVQVQPGRGIKVGRLFIGTSSDMFMRNFYYAGANGNPPFPVYSYADVKQGKVPADAFRGKIVLIGATALGVGTSFPTPTSPTMSPALVMANVISSILQQNFFTKPGWAGWITFLALLLITAYLAIGLPRLKPGIAALVSVGLIVLMLVVEFGMMKSKFVWVPLMVPVLMLVVGHLVVTIIRSGMLNRMLVRSEADSAESNKMLGLAFQGQGQLDMAFEKFRKCPMDDSIADLLYNLALDYERKRQFNKAGSVFSYINDFNPKFRDIGERLHRAKQLEGTVILGGGGGGTAAGTMILGDGTVQKPMLGRYQVEKELGKGAMGVVYLGRDPKINRVVAIKTMALSQEFDADELTEVKARFFREAETAGRLNHPNIVTIYDAGEEHDLAYIAMEFLKGKDLTSRTKGNALLPAKTVLDIIAKAADALDYAHSQNVVHRDIKPANIMYDEEKGEIKVTDFGIARITDSSKTKTGMVLGTPSYMSPEQLSGKKVDGRSDLFSLGVTMYQLLAGQLPFQADSMATLMFKIANETHAPVTLFRGELPASIDTVIDKAMQKDPEQRYQRGAEFAKDVRACAAQIS
ncbi:MAG TPA: serine/threonine-protein kinase [Gammaproteobacteria bacterium]